VIFGYFEWVFTVFVKIWPKKSVFLEIFGNAAQRLIWPPLIQEPEKKEWYNGEKGKEKSVFSP
jgi:hypothetical protein